MDYVTTQLVPRSQCLGLLDRLVLCLQAWGRVIHMHAVHGPYHHSRPILQSPQGCDLPGSPTATSCSENKAAEAGHDRSLGSIPTMLINNKAISYDAWSICQYPQGPSSQQACGRKATRNSFVVGG